MKLVYGANCLWWDTIDKTKVRKSGIPCCPHCGGVLYETEEKRWWDSVDEFEKQGNPGHRKLVEWMRGRCFPNGSAAKLAYYMVEGEWRKL